MSGRKLVIYAAVIAVFLTQSSCSVLRTFENIGRLKFRLGSVDEFFLNGIKLTAKSKLGDFSASELLKLTTSVANKRLPVSFVLGVEALNPNSGSGGGERTDLTLKSFPWKLYIDDKETVSGNIASPVFVPGKGESTVFPLTVALDLYSIFGNGNYEKLINLALQTGGLNRSASHLKLVAKPTVSSSIGDITYPREITIVDKQFN